MLKSKLKEKGGKVNINPKQRKKTNSNEEEKEHVTNIFTDQSESGSIFLMAGAFLSSGSKNVQLNKDASLFRLQVTKLIKTHAEYSRNADQMADYLINLMKNRDVLKCFLMPISLISDKQKKTEENFDDNLSSKCHDSFLKILFSIEELQTRLMNQVIEKLIDLNLQENNDSKENSSISSLIIRQFCWIDNILKQQELVDKLLESVQATSVNVQMEIICCLPDIIQDSQHQYVSKQLMDLMYSEPDLLLAVLDALSNLNLNEESLEQMKLTALELLPSVDVEKLPIILKFLIQKANNQDASKIVNEIRKNVDIVALAKNKSSVPASKNNTKGDVSKDNSSLIMDSIKSGLRFHKYISLSWIKAIESCKKEDDFKILDFVVLLALYIYGHKKQVETIIRSRILNGHLSSNHLQEIFLWQSALLQEYFNNGICCLTSCLMRSVQPLVSHFAAELFKLSFMHFDQYSQQEVIGSLVTHVGSGSSNEIERSLRTLSQLANDNLEKMIPFSIFVKGLLDYLENLNLAQIRMLYQVLCHLAFNKYDYSNMQDCLHMLIRKQLSNSSSRRYQMIGVIGAVMMIKNISLVKMYGDRTINLDINSINTSNNVNVGTQKGKEILKGNDTSKRKDNNLTDQEFKQVVEILELVKKSVKCFSNAYALFLEELAVLVKQQEIHAKVQKWISENVTNDFQADYVVDVLFNQIEDKTDLSSLKWRHHFGLDVNLNKTNNESANFDDDDDGAIGINILPMVERYHALSSKGRVDEMGLASIYSLSSSFRLLHACELVDSKDGNLEGIDALLGCYVKLPDIIEITENYKKKSKLDKTIICDSIFIALNWFRELLNAFSNQKEKEMKNKVINRLATIIDLQELLYKFLIDTPTDYMPPIVNYDFNIQNQSLVTLPKKSKPMARKSKRKGKLEKLKAKSKTKKRKGTKRDGDEGTDENDDDIEINESGNDENVEDKSSDTSLIETKSKSSSTENLETPASNKLAHVNINMFLNFVRNFDLNVFQILTYSRLSFSKMHLLDTLPEESSFLDLEGRSLLFILDNLHRKLNHCLDGDNKKKSFGSLRSNINGTNYNSLNLIGSQQLISNMGDLMPHLCRHLETVCSYFQITMNEQDESVNLTMDENALSLDCNESNNMAEIFSALLKIFATFFSWCGFHEINNKDILKKSILHITTRLSGSSIASQCSQTQLSTHAFSYMENLSRHITKISHAHALVKLLTSLAGRILSVQWTEKSGDLCMKFLKRKWPEELKKIDFNESFQFILQSCFQNGGDVQEKLELFISTAVPEIIEDQVSTTFPTINKDTFSVFYKTILLQLNDLSKSVAGSSDKLNNSKSCEEKLLVWLSLVKIFNVLVNLIKTFDSRLNFLSVLKLGRLFIESFLRHCMPMLDHIFLNHKDDIQVLLKSLQMSTRTLHHICSHSKIVKDLSLTNQVPPLKRVLEQFVHRVKSMLMFNKCVQAFWLGNLKNRNLKGDEILSQASSQNSTIQSDVENDSSAKESEDGEDSNKMEGHNSNDENLLLMYDGPSTSKIQRDISLNAKPSEPTCYNSDVSDTDMQSDSSQIF